MKLPIYQVDAFTDRLFGGNPAAVCPLDYWPDDRVLQHIAMENNLAETAFYVREPDGTLRLRWFTPEVEVDLCGHATLAAAFVLFECEGYEGSVIHFESLRSGTLRVTRHEGHLTLDFPADRLERSALDLTGALGRQPVEVWKGKTDYLAVYAAEEDILTIRPRFDLLRNIAARGVIVTAPGVEADFVSRFFAPQCGVDEDPVTGSAHTSLTPYWADRTGKTQFSAIQRSRRQGRLSCSLVGDRVHISGQARLYLKGEIVTE